MPGHKETEVLRSAAAAEHRQPHPIARAILTAAEAQDLALPELDDASYRVGYGIEVLIEGRRVRVGSARYLREEGLRRPPELAEVERQAEADSHTLIYVGIDEELAGVLEMAPTLRPEAQAVVEFLKARNIDMIILSGDHEAPTRRMAETLGIERYFAETLPEHKADKVKKLREEGRFVCFIGDGINDAIALKAAQVSMSLKGASSAATPRCQDRCRPSLIVCV
jgi:Cu2+-exporting ATPase